jgi:hypothetical protein
MGLDAHSTPSEPAQVAERLASIDKTREEQRENFHLYQEVQALPSSDRDALFQILEEAQSGNPELLQTIYELVYDEQPVPIDEFVLGAKFLGLKGLINDEKLLILERVAHPALRRAWIAAGSGSGKSFLVSILQAWQIYQLLCLKRPDFFYMLGPGSKIAAINVSIGKDQARDVIFAEFLARLSHAPWFRGKYRHSMAKAAFPKNVFAFSGGFRAISYYGYHTIFGSLDEASFMLEGEREMAEDLIEALSKSLTTRFPRASKLLVISTLRSPEDFLYRNIERVREDGLQLV